MGMLCEYAIIIFLAEEDISGGEAVLDGFSCELEDGLVIIPVFVPIFVICCFPI